MHSLVWWNQGVTAYQGTEVATTTEYAFTLHRQINWKELLVKKTWS